MKHVVRDHVPLGAHVVRGDVVRGDVVRGDVVRGDVIRGDVVRGELEAVRVGAGCGWRRLPREQPGHSPSGSGHAGRLNPQLGPCRIASRHQ